MLINNAVITGSFVVNGTDVTGVTGSSALSSSYLALSASYLVTSASYASTSGSIASRTTLIEGQYATTGSNTFTGVQYVSQASNASSFTSTASLYTAGGMRVGKDMYVSGTAYFNNVTVYGTQSVNYITSSQLDISDNIITVNTFTPAVRFGGLAVYDSGSTGLTGSILWDSENNRWIYSNPSGSSYDGGMIISGPRNTTGLGNEQGTTANYVMKGQGGDHITSSVIYESASMVSIGTSTPLGDFTVSNPTTVNTYIVSAGGDYDTNLYLGYAGAYTSTYIKRVVGNLSLGTSATDRVYITSAGNVGIGTSSPSTISGYTITQIEGSTSGLLAFSSAGTVQGRLYGGSTLLAIESMGSRDIVNYTNSTERMRITSTGNVGIGVTTPYAKLNVNGSAQFGPPTLQTSGTDLVIVGQNSSTGPDDGNCLGLYVNHAAASASPTVSFTYQFRQNDNSGANLYGNAVKVTKNAGANSTFTTFHTNSTIGAGTERMRITSAGSLCIGQTSSDYGIVAIKSNNTTAYMGLNVYANGNGNFTYMNHDNSVGIIGTEFGSSGTGHTPLTFQSGGSEKFRIGTGGDVGAMTAVTGQGGSLGSYKNFYWGAGIIMGRDAYDSYYCGNIYYDGSWRLKYGGYYGNVVNWYGGEYSFQTSTSNGSANSAVSLQATLFLDRNGNAVFKGSVTQNGSPSDINLKENLVKISSPLEKIAQINGYNFDWKEGTHANGMTIPVAEGMQAPDAPLTLSHDAGLIAQEVEEIMPELVRESGHKSLNYNGIIALLVEGMKEQQAQIEVLKTEIETLKNK